MAILIKLTPLMSAKITLMAIMNYNLTFSSFQLLYLPMLDGWCIIKQFIPYKYYDSVYQFESMSMFVFLIIVMTNTHMTMIRPIYNILSSVVNLFI